MARAALKFTLCVCILAIVSCNSNDSADVKKLRDELEASKAENARLKAELETFKSQGGNQKGTEEEFADDGDFSRANGSGKYDFSYKKVYARAPELVIEMPKEASRSISYEVSERRLDGFTIQVKALTYDNTEQLAVLLKSIKWRVKGMIPRTAK